MESFFPRAEHAAVMMYEDTTVSVHRDSGIVVTKEDISTGKNSTVRCSERSFTKAVIDALDVAGSWGNQVSFGVADIYGMVRKEKTALYLELDCGNKLGAVHIATLMAAMGYEVFVEGKLVMTNTMQYKRAINSIVDINTRLSEISKKINYI